MSALGKKVDKLYNTMTLEERVDGIAKLCRKASAREFKGEPLDDIELEIEKIKSGISPNDGWEYNRLFNKRLLEDTGKEYEEILYLSDLQRRVFVMESWRRMHLQMLYETVLELMIEKMKKGIASQEDLENITHMNPLILIAVKDVLPEEWRDDPQLFCHLLLVSTMEEFERDLMSPEKKKEYDALVDEISSLNHEENKEKSDELVERRRKLMPISTRFKMERWIKMWEVEEEIIKEMVEKIEPYDKEFGEKLTEAPLTVEAVDNFVEIFTEKRLNPA